MNTLKLSTLLAFVAIQFSLNAQVTFQTSVASTDGYNVDIEVQLLSRASSKSH